MSEGSLIISGQGLTIDSLMRVARERANASLSNNASIRSRLEASRLYIQEAIDRGECIYGITSGFGGMGYITIAREEAADLQNNLPWFLKTGAGEILPTPDIRAAMLLRANSLMRGVSGIRFELIERLILFLNQGVTPHVHSLGSIGASGDLVPLAGIAGALIGLDDSFLVDFKGETMPSPKALKLLGLVPIKLNPKEGLALVNGTSVHTGIAAGCLHDMQLLLALTLSTHAMILQGLAVSNESFHAFIHNHKAHPGQCFVASQMLRLLDNSTLIRDEIGRKHHSVEDGQLIQDRYSVRCLPQFLGPVVDGFALIRTQVEVEMNAATDNPLIDSEEAISYHGGNFLGQYVAVGMDHFRYYIGLLAKHLDVQIALLVESSFSGGLADSLVGNPYRKVNMGLKGLQLTGNSIMPLLQHLGNSLADRFPTHAEQFNQNINSQGLGSANLSRQSIALLQQYLAHALIFGVQAADLRTYKTHGHYDARVSLSPATLRLYETVKKLVGKPPSPERPLVFNDHEQSLDKYLAVLSKDIATGVELRNAVAFLVEEISKYRPYK